MKHLEESCHALPILCDKSQTAGAPQPKSWQRNMKPLSQKSHSRREIIKNLWDILRDRPQGFQHRIFTNTLSVNQNPR